MHVYISINLNYSKHREYLLTVVFSFTFWYYFLKYYPECKIYCLVTLLLKYYTYWQEVIFASSYLFYADVKCMSLMLQSVAKPFLHLCQRCQQIHGLYNSRLLSARVTKAKDVSFLKLQCLGLLVAFS